MSDKKISPKAAVAQQFTDYVPVQIYTDGGKDGAANQKLQQDKFGDVALPLYAVVDPSTEAPVDKIAGVVSPDTFESFLSNAKSKVSLPAPGDGQTASAKPGPWSPLDQSL